MGLSRPYFWSDQPHCSGKQPFLEPDRRLSPPLCPSGPNNITRSIQTFKSAISPNGSGAGIGLTLTGMVDFGGTDAPVSDAQLAQAPVKVSHFPVILGADVPAYNLPEVQTQLRFTRASSGRYFPGQNQELERSGDCRKQSRSSIARQANLGRASQDGSGTTYIWADYLVESEP